MNIVDQYVYESILNYPSIFPTRRAVLIHTLLVIGNGCEWNADGTMGHGINKYKHHDKVSAVAEIEKERLEELEKRKEWMGNFGEVSDEVAEAMTKIDNEILDKLSARYDDYANTVMQADILAVQKSQVISPDEVTENSHYYEKSFNTYAMIRNLPENIHPEWLDACIEVAYAVKDINPDASDLVDALLLRKLK